MTGAPQTMSASTRLPDLHGGTHVGRVRSENQDHFLACTVGSDIRVSSTSLPALPSGWIPRNGDTTLQTGDALVAAVADGVGGGPGGEEASRSALAFLPREVEQALGDGLATATLAGRLTSAVLRVHTRLAERGVREPALAGMATTLSVWVGVGDRAFVVQVGDSRCYRLRDGALEQLSMDQTMAQDLVNQGVIPSVDQAPAGWDNILTSALGGGGAEPVVTATDRRAGDVVLVCSDGVMKHFTDERIAHFLAAPMPAREIAGMLVDGAVKDGGVDNVTALVLKEPA